MEPTAKTTFKENASFQLDASVGAASISPSGRDVAFASNEGLQIVDLDNPLLTPRSLPHDPAGNIADVQWSPHAVRESWVVVAAGNIAILLDVATSTPSKPVKRDLRGHNRAIADLNFAVFRPDVLATSSLDTFVHLWDLREACIRPAARLADWLAGGYQVKWNRQDENFLASSHDNRLHIWDIRKGALPIRTIDAHVSRIYGIDWNRDYRDNILTCSLDHTVKLWNWARDPDPKGDSIGDPIDRIIRTSYPVWRARHTPFGYGIIAMAAGEDHHLNLYDRRTKRLSDRDAAIDPVRTFGGHTGRVQEFLWRYRGAVEDGRDSREFQLLSWGRDKKLCLHKVPTKTLAMVGFEKGGPYEGSMVFTREGAEYKSFRFESQATVPNTAAAKLGNQPCRSKRFPRDIFGSTIKGQSFSDHFHSTNFRSFVSPVGLDDIQKVRESHAGVTREDSATETVQIKSDAMNGELDHIIRTLPVKVEKVNLHKGSVRICVDGPWGVHKTLVEVQITLKFPVDYPQSSPSFRLNLNPLAYPGASSILEWSISSILKGHSKRQAPCLEPALEFLLGRRSFDEFIPSHPMSADLGGAENAELKDLDQKESLESAVIDDVPSEEDEDFSLGNSMTDIAPRRNPHTLSPRMTGATFAANGQLVCFFLVGTTPTEPRKAPDESGFRGKIAQLMSQEFSLFGIATSEFSPSNGSDSDLSTKQSSLSDGGSRSSLKLRTSGTSQENNKQYPLEAFGIQSHDVQPDQIKLLYKDRYENERAFKGSSIVSINPLEDMILLSEGLARNYRMSGPPSEACAHNSKVSKLHADAESNPHYIRVTEMWRDASVVASGPLPTGQKVVSQTLAELEATGDVQNLATLSTVLADEEERSRPEGLDTIGQAAQILGEDCMWQIQKASMDRMAVMNPKNPRLTLLNQDAFDATKRHSPLLRVDDHRRHCRFRESYGEQLYSWQLYTARNEMLKRNGHMPEKSNEYRVRLEDTAVGGTMPQCPLCWQQICGTAAMCPVCKHALHLGCHLSLNIETGIDLQCPAAGCGCHCLTDGMEP